METGADGKIHHWQMCYSTKLFGAYICSPEAQRDGQASTCRTDVFQDGAVAQLVEQRTENPCVGGSIPPHTTETLAYSRGFVL
jgi:hypothetical protein